MGLVTWVGRIGGLSIDRSAGTLRPRQHVSLRWRCVSGGHGIADAEGGRELLLLELGRRLGGARVGVEQHCRGLVCRFSASDDDGAVPALGKNKSPATGAAPHSSPGVGAATGPR
eukprot:2590450-Rhodomonas_salina.1